MTARFWINICVSLMVLVSLAVWARHESGIFVERIVPRIGHLRLWPDANAVVNRSRIERLNINMPDFQRLVKAISGDDSVGERQEILKAGVRYYDYVIDWAPERFDAYLVKGICEYRRGRYPEAETAFKKAMALQPDFFWSYYNLGMLYFNAGAYKPALEFLDRAQVLARGYDVRALLGSKIFVDLLRFDEDRELPVRFAQALQDIQTARGMGYFFLALAARGQGDTEGFQRYYDEAQALGFDQKSSFVGKKFPLRAY